MRTIRNILYVGTFSVLALGLSACETMKSAGDKITSIDVPFYGEDEEAAADSGAMAKSANCPQVAVVEDLKSLTQFEVPSAPSPGTKISSVAMTGLESACAVTEKTVAVDITVRFDGQLGPQATDWETPSRSFAYPYFIAVTTPAGDILSKEVFAATIRYDQGETAINQQEKIRQVIPLREDAAPAGYEILVGFQLTEDELNYSRQMASQPAVTEATDTTADKMEPEAKATPVQPEVKAAPAAPVAATPIAAPPPAAAAAPVATPVTVQPQAIVEKPAEQPVPTTTDGSVTAAPTSAEVVDDAPEPVAETTTPAQTAPAPTDPAVVKAETTTETSTTTTVAPAVPNPYAPPPTQVIRIKPDGSVEKK